jgi:DNA-binding response OmpR family regulator
MKAAKVLVVEDDRDIRVLLRAILERNGLEVIESVDGRDGLRRFYERQPALVILDVAMPELDGWQVLERIRELSDVPILMLTASAGELDTVRGLKAGADDYLTKPFRHQEFVARVESLLRRRGDDGPPAEVLADSLVEIDFPKRVVTVKGQEVDLTPTEFRLLAAFVRHPNLVLSQDQLLDLVWDQADGRAPEQVKLYVGYLRRKLDEVGVQPIETVRGFGYRYGGEA